MESEKASMSKKFKILIALILVSTLSAGFFIYQGKDIHLSVDGEVSSIVSRAKTVEDFLEKEEVKFDKGAYINVPLDTKLEKDLEIVIINPKPYIVKGKDINLEFLSVYDTVEKILEEQGIELGNLDYVSPELSASIEPNSTIEIFRVNEEVVVEDSAIPFKEETKSTNQLDRGTKRIAQRGKEGLKQTTIKKRYVNGELESSTVEKEEVVREPLVQIVELGTREKVVVTSRGNLRYSKSIIMQASAYTDDKASQGKWVGKTASGRTPQYGVVAVDPRVIPLGTKLYIEGYGNAVAGDTGGAIKGNRIDLFYNTRSEALRFGRRNVKVYILN